MTKLCIPLSSHTSFPNTPESDKRPTVSCDVKVKLLDGTTETVRFHSADPGTAIDDIKSMPDSRFTALARVRSE